MDTQNQEVPQKPAIPDQSPLPQVDQPLKEPKKKLFTPLKVLIAIVVVFVIVGVIAEVAKPSSTPKKTATIANEEPEENRAFDMTININPTSFDPSYATVYAYTKVTFINVGTVGDISALPAGSYYGPPRAIAVNPTSTGPDKGFKGSGEIPAPSSWGYIFTKPGTYTYHDANTPSINGTIVVIPDPPGFKIQDDGKSVN